MLFVIGLTACKFLTRNTIEEVAPSGAASSFFMSEGEGDVVIENGLILK